MYTKYLICITFCLTYTLSMYCQLDNPQSINRNRFSKEIPFSIKDYKELGDHRSDTVWVPQRLVRYNWNGTELAINPIYHIFRYANPYEISSIVTMDSYTDDSLLLYCYEYDESYNTICELYKTYNNTNSDWVNDFKLFHEYDDFGCRARTLVQAWEKEISKWRDSLVNVVVYVDTNEPIEYYIEEYLNKEWVKSYGYQWVYSYTPEQYVYEVNCFQYNTETMEHENSSRADFILNDDGSWYESTWQEWDKSEEAWINVIKYTDVAWKLYNRYPNNYKNLTEHRVFHWWIGDDWYTYRKDDWEYPTSELDDINMKAWAWSETINDWYLCNRYKSRHYPNNMKRRYTDSIKNGVNEQWLQVYDDSARWYFYKGALEEMYRVNYDTARNEWLPAARMVYSDFVPFVDSTGIGENEIQENSLMIVPNPANNSIDIINENLIDRVSIFDINGKLLIEKEKQKNTPRIRVSISTLTKGIYIVNATTVEGKLFSDKLIVN